MNFTHAFTPVPLCTPARNCLLHGQWPTQHGCITNMDSEAWKAPAEDLPSFKVKHAVAKDGEEFLPYSRDEKGARPWAIPFSAWMIPR